MSEQNIEQEKIKNNRMVPIRYYPHISQKDFINDYKEKTQYDRAVFFFENIKSSCTISELAQWISTKKIKQIVIELVKNKIVSIKNDTLTHNDNLVRCRYCFYYHNFNRWIYQYDKLHHLEVYHYFTQDRIKTFNIDINRYFDTRDPMPKKEHEWTLPEFDENKNIVIECKQCGIVERFYPSWKNECTLDYKELG